MYTNKIKISFTKIFDDLLFSMGLSNKKVGKVNNTNLIIKSLYTSLAGSIIKINIFFIK